MQKLQNLKGSCRVSSAKHAFTLPELLIVVGIMALLLLVLIPAQAGSRTKSQGIRCLDNFRQLMNAVMLYTSDYHDLFPPNEDDSSTIAGHTWCPGFAGVGGLSEFNPDIVTNRCLLMPYVNTNVTLLRCTADLRVGTYQGTDPAKIGKLVPAARSISMNGAVGTMCPGYDSGGSHSGKPTLSVNGPWLDGTHTHKRNSPYRTYGRLSDVVIPGPAKLWIIAEEDPVSLNDAVFSHNVGIPEWIDFPGTQHEMSCVIGFGDGHVELHRWVTPSTRVPFPIARRSVPGSADWAWLSERTSARVQ